MYTIPLNPTDLVEIYRVRTDNPNYVLEVDYGKSKEHLNPNQILTYLANTGFVPKFSYVDEELVEAYIKLPFVLESYELSRIAAEQVLEYVSDKGTFVNGEVLEDLVVSLMEVVPFCAQSVNDFAEGTLTVDIESVEVYEQDSEVGVNLLYIIMFGLDILLELYTIIDLTGKYNEKVFTDEPRYGGRDIYHALANSNVVTYLLVHLLPEALNAPNKE